LGYNATTCDETRIFSPFLGLGFYFLSKALKPCIIRYNYFNLYVPLGFELQWDVKDDFAVGLNATYRLDAYTRLKPETPCIALCDKLKIKRSHGFKVELPLMWQHTLCKRANVQTKVIPFFDWNKFGATKEKTCYCIPFPIPEIKRWYIGIKVLLGFKF